MWGSLRARRPLSVTKAAAWTLGRKLDAETRGRAGTSGGQVLCEGLERHAPGFCFDVTQLELSNRN